MKTFIQNGDVITVTAPSGGVASGHGVVVGSLFGIAAFTASEGDSVEIATTGIPSAPFHQEKGAVRHSLARGPKLHADQVDSGVKQPLVKEPRGRVSSHAFEVVMEYRFTIADSFTPETLPMERLGDYVAALARLLGEQANVHFRGIEAGSAVLVATIDQPAQPKVRDRVIAVRDGGGPSDARKAYGDLDEMLRKDNATGTLSDEAGGVVIPFPGRNRPEPLVYGPFREDGTIDGQLIRVGGRDETVPVHLRDGAIIHTGLICTPEIARKIAPHLFGPTLRVHGTGTWFRTEAGVWELQSFRISDFEVLDDAPLTEVVGKLRKVEGSDWSTVPDPVRTLLAERHGDEGAH